MAARRSGVGSRAAIGSLLMLGAYAGCYPDFDGLSSGAEDEGTGGTSTGGSLSGSAGALGATGGDTGVGGEGGDSAGNGGGSNGGSSNGGSNNGGSSNGGSSNGGSSNGGTSTGGKGGSSGGKGGTGTGGTTAGKGGSAGSGGATANGGTGGSGSGGSGSGGSGSGGSGGQPSSCMEPVAGVTATGLMMLTVPLMSTGQGQRFNVQNRTSPSMPYDMAGATLTIRAHAPCAVGGNLSIFFRSSNGATESPSMRVALSTLVDGFVDIAVPVPPVTGNFDPATVDIIRIEVEADPAHGSTFRSPATIVYIDSILSSNTSVTYPFDVSPTHLEFGDSGARPLTGSSFVWRSAYP